MPLSLKQTTMKIQAINEFLSNQPREVLYRIQKDYCEKNQCSPKEAENIELLSNHLVDWGDAGYVFNTDITEFLIGKFCNYAYDIVQDRYSLDDVKKMVDTNDSIDLLMDDWEDILKEVINGFVCVCDCGNVIYEDTEHEYVYETGGMQYKCSDCDNWIHL